ncbi:MAG TPA: DUF6263 family protein [Agriterribacter sp.]|nr:DUF6263 family protein [Agriterribacter sp.]
MKRSYPFILLVALLAQCTGEFRKEPDLQLTIDKDHPVQLRFNPSPGSVYCYDTENEIAIEVDMEGKKIKNRNKSTIINTYSVSKDTGGGFRFNIRYNKIKTKTENGDIVTEADADNAALSVYPLEKMLGIVKDQDINVFVDVSGKVKAISGYDEVKAKLMEGFAPDDTYSRDIARAQWDKVIGSGMIKEQAGHIFNMTPDSMVYQGYQWKARSIQRAEIPMNVTTTYTVSKIDPGNKIIVLSDATMTSVTTPAAGIIPVQPEVVADLKGIQKGTIEIDALSGMVIKSEISGTIKGTIQVMGNTLPALIKTKLKIHRYP